MGQKMSIGNDCKLDETGSRMELKKALKAVARKSWNVTKRVAKAIDKALTFEEIIQI